MKLWPLSCLTALSAGLLIDPALAEDDRLPVGQFVTISGTLDPVAVGSIQNQALELQRQAEAGEKKRQAVLVLEIREGASTFGEVLNLVQFLRDPRIAGVTTVAWIPETLTGNNVVLALACNEIIMDPDAELGDIGRGKAVDPDTQAFVVGLAKKKHNRKLSPALVRSLLDPQTAVVRATVARQENGQKATETVVLTPEELAKLQQENVEIADVVRLKEAGQPGLYTGSQARDNQILIIQTAENRGEVADIYNLPREAMREKNQGAVAERVFLIEIREPILPVLEAFLERQIARAVSLDADLIIFEIDADRGMLMTSTQLANRIAELDADKIRTVAYIPQAAEGGAAIVALGCDEIYMHPNAVIGNISPRRILNEQDKPLDADGMAKLVDSLTRLARRKHRPEAVVLGMARESVPVFQVANSKTGRVSYMTDEELANSGEFIKGPALPESLVGGRLTLEGSRAQELLIAQAPVADRDEFKQRIGVPESTKLKAIGRSWVDTIVFWLNSPSAAFVLIALGIACLWVELHTMSGFLGIVSALCFTLFFWSRLLGGTAGWLEVMLFVLGTGCLILEIFFIPGFGVFGVSGAVLVFVSLIMASHTFGQWEPDSNSQELMRNIGTLCGSVISVVFAALLLSRFLPQIPFLNKIILAPPHFGVRDLSEPQLRPDSSGADSEMIGALGKTVTTLRPFGKALIEHQYMDVVSEGGYLESGVSVEVVGMKGSTPIVREQGAESPA